MKPAVLLIKGTITAHADVTAVADAMTTAATEAKMISSLKEGL